jgi:rubredoxin
MAISEKRRLHIEKLRILNTGKPSKLKGLKRKPFTDTWKSNMSNSAKKVIRIKRVIPIDILCKECNIIFKILPSNTKRNRGIFCSTDCYYKWLSKNKILENHNNWQGGKSFEEYSVDWKDTLKKSIRIRDNYTCKLCGKIQSNLDKKEFDVHHIDYNKKNCNPNNLITLCRSCHMKTNYKRSYYKKLFNKNG